MKGYIALTVVLLIVPLLLLAGVDSVYKNLTSLIVGRMNYDSKVLEINTETCLEESVYIIKRSPAYTGNLILTMGDWLCNITIENNPTDTKIKRISIEAIGENDISKKIIKELNTNENPFSLRNM